MVVFDSDQGRSAFATAVVVTRRGLQKSENDGLRLKMPFLDGHSLDGALKGHNRETGENPVRTRRCDRERKPPYATVHFEILISLLNGWEGAVSRMIRESEDLPFKFCF